MSLRTTLLGFACVASASCLAGESVEIVNAPAADLRWETSAQGVGFAPLEGDRFAGAYMAMVRLPAGLVSPAHVKSSSMFGVVVQGTLTHLAVGADPGTEQRLPAGSFYKIPAGLAHISKCVSVSDCTTFLYQDGKFDFVPVKP